MRLVGDQLSCFDRSGLHRCEYAPLMSGSRGFLILVFSGYSHDARSVGMAVIREKAAPVSHVNVGGMRTSVVSRSPTGLRVLLASWPWASAGLIAFMLMGVVAVIMTLPIVLG